MPLEESLPYRALLWSLRLAWAGIAFGAAMMLPVLFGASSLVIFAKIGFAEGFAACAVALPAFALSMARVTGAILDEPRTVGRRADALMASVLGDLLDPDWSSPS